MNTTPVEHPKLAPILSPGPVTKKCISRFYLDEKNWHSLFLDPDTALSPNQLKEFNDTWKSGFEPFNENSIRAEERENYDIWYRCHFQLDDVDTATQSSLKLEGLATIADVWLNDSHLLSSENMFLQHHLDISELIRAENSLYIRVLALAPKLNERKPRAKWRTPFVNHKNLGWFRTSQLGRIPTWSPPPPIIGPWLPVSIVQRRRVAFDSPSIHCRLDNETGIVDVSVNVHALSGHKIEQLTFHVGDHCVDLVCPEPNEHPLYFCAQMRIEQVQLWWPHTHGTAYLYPTFFSALVDGEPCSVASESLGFRKLKWYDLDSALNSTSSEHQDFALHVNDKKIFCRGACWTPISTHVVPADEKQIRDALLQLANAGVNMLRVSGTFYYEQDSFYRLCDELGILVWQDFMFARLAYPFENEQFLQSVLIEVTQILQRLHFRPSLAILCGNTEIEQQTAMLGLPLDEDYHFFFRKTLADLCNEISPHTAYWPSSPAGGEMPMTITQGVSHYFGVGGYQRGLEDAQVNCPQFASECLAFSNVPENAGLTPFLPDHAGFPTHPVYKAGVPRDVSSGWDFADITDHYIERLFKVDTRQLRYQDPQKYYTLAKITCGEVMSKVFGMWRRTSSPCNGALVWLLRDLQKGAGWGFIDSNGLEKSSYYYLKRIWSPLALWFVDEGLNGVSLNLSHEKDCTLQLELEVIRYRANGTIAISKRIPLALSGRKDLQWNVESFLGQFFDITYSYRFGPREFMLVQARLWSTMRKVSSPNNEPEIVSESFYYPVDMGMTASDEPELEVSARRSEDGSYLVSISTKRFARAVAMNTFPLVPDDNYFDIAPNSTRCITLKGVGKHTSSLGSVSVFNGLKTYTIIASDV